MRFRGGSVGKASPTNTNCNSTWIESRKDGNQRKFTAFFCPVKLKKNYQSLDIGINLEEIDEINGN